MTLLHLAVGQHRDPLLHAAAPGDRLTLCGRELEKVTDQQWGSEPAQLCERCANAASLLRIVRAV